MATSKVSSAVETLKKAIRGIPISIPLSNSSSNLSGKTTSLASDRRLIEIVFSFDTTGSLFRCLAEIHTRLTDIVQRLQADIPGIRIAIIAHGDYCDTKKYVIQWIDFGATLPELVDFIQKVEKTDGGDRDKCYELVLQRAREVLSWTPGSSRSLVIIGDSDPHSPGYDYGGIAYEINWKAEMAKLQVLNVRRTILMYEFTVLQSIIKEPRIFTKQFLQ
ncbi:hypothetical protein KUTeg_020397 [Tegillarca granosa]|uniref:VWFA domain-containing protein n=1 Tax=Tegillarca granosa TaxID=220873 RepID=A0ABQ9ED78_TEGGR|nr:hypothetical protein KUTeg_020397 [Tegillarca granosa]